MKKRLKVRESNQKVVSIEKALYFEELLKKQNLVGEILVNTEKKSIYEVTQEIINIIFKKDTSKPFA